MAHDRLQEIASRLRLGMVSTGIVQLMRHQEDIEMMPRLGYPNYLLTILGVWKILGVIAGAHS